MCAVSNVGTWGQQQWQQPGGLGTVQIDQISRAEFEQLRNEVLEMKRLLLAAKEFDRKTGQPDCEQEDKIKILKDIAAKFGVDLKEVFENTKK